MMSLAVEPQCSPAVGTKGKASVGDAGSSDAKPLSSSTSSSLWMWIFLSGILIRSKLVA